MNVQLAAIKITDETVTMHSIMKKCYEDETKGKMKFQIANLGQSTQHFNFFVTQSVSNSISQSQGSCSGSLMNKLISLSSEGKFSIIDSVFEKVSKKTEEKKNKSVDKSSDQEILSSVQKGSTTTQQFDIIEEEDEEINEEEEIEKQLDQFEQNEE